MKEKGKLFVRVAIAAVVIGIVVVATRPENEVEKQLDKLNQPKKDDLAEMMKKIPQQPDIKTDSIVGKPIQQQAKERMASLPGSQIKKEVGKNIKHSTNAVVRAADQLAGDIKTDKKEELPMVEADFDNPLSITFDGLKKLHFAVKLSGQFPRNVVEKMNGAAVEMVGAVMPIDTPNEEGEMQRFWLANPSVVMAGCAFCNPPTMADLVFIQVPLGQNPIKVNREKLYRDTVLVKMKGRFIFGPEVVDKGLVYLFGMEYYEFEVLN